MTFTSQMVSLRKAGQILGKSNPFMSKLAAKGYLRTVKVGERFMVHLSEIERFQREGNYIAKGSSDGQEANSSQEVDEIDGTETGIRPIKPEEIQRPRQTGGYTLDEAEAGHLLRKEGSGSRSEVPRSTQAGASSSQRGGVPERQNDSHGAGSSGYDGEDNESNGTGQGIRSGQRRAGSHGQEISPGGDQSTGEEGRSNNESPEVADGYPPYLREIIKKGSV